MLKTLIIVKILFLIIINAVQTRPALSLPEFQGLDNANSETEQETLIPVQTKHGFSLILEKLCPESGTECLFTRAIASSAVIKELEDKIELTGKQINYLEEKIDYYSSRNWTDYITLDPIKFVQNIFGGGDVQKTQLTITDLQVKVDRLKSEQINLETQVNLKSEELKNKVVGLVFKITELEQKIALLKEQIETFNLQTEFFLIKYNKGEGSTTQYLSYQDKQDKLDFQLLTLQNDYKTSVNKLLLLVNN